MKFLEFAEVLVENFRRQFDRKRDLSLSNLGLAGTFFPGLTIGGFRVIFYVIFFLHPCRRVQSKYDCLLPLSIYISCSCIPVVYKKWSSTAHDVSAEYYYGTQDLYILFCQEP
ncbi:hypothetical protein SLA2020_178910 [Shorea laevis]